MTVVTPAYGVIVISDAVAGCSCVCGPARQQVTHDTQTVDDRSLEEDGYSCRSLSKLFRQDDPQAVGDSELDATPTLLNILMANSDSCTAVSDPCQ